MLLLRNLIITTCILITATCALAHDTKNGKWNPIASQEIQKMAGNQHWSPIDKNLGANGPKTKASSAEKKDYLYCMTKIAKQDKHVNRYERTEQSICMAVKSDEDLNAITPKLVKLLDKIYNHNKNFGSDEKIVKVLFE